MEEGKVIPEKPAEEKGGEDLTAFRRAMGEYMEKEKNGEIRTAHFLQGTESPEGAFDPERLNEMDMAMWQKLQKGELTRDDLENYRKDFTDEKGLLRTDADRSRAQFLGFLVNKAVLGIALKESKEN